MAEYTQSERNEAARVLEKFQQGVYGYVGKVDVALGTAIACLRSPIASPDVDGKAGGWVRTSERAPTEADADDDGYVPCLLKGMFTGRTIRIALKYQVVTADIVMFFLPLPALPEVDNG